MQKQNCTPRPWRALLCSRPQYRSLRAALMAWFRYAAPNTRARKRSKFARPYICRLSVFKRLLCPSTGPLVHGYSRDAATACYSWRMPTAKVRNSGTGHCSALSTQAERATRTRSFSSCRNASANSRTTLTSGAFSHRWATNWVCSAVSAGGGRCSQVVTWRMEGSLKVVATCKNCARS